MNLIVLVTGSRTIEDADFINSTLDRYEIARIIVGDAAGVDKIVKMYADAHQIPIEGEVEEGKVWVPDWKRFGKAAGNIRNGEMVKRLLSFSNNDKYNGIVGIAFWDGHSRGTKNCINQMQKKGIRVDIYGH